MKLLTLLLLLLLAVTLAPAGHRRVGRVSAGRRVVRVVRTTRGPKVVRLVGGQPGARFQP